MLRAIEEELNAREQSGVLEVQQQHWDDKPTGAALMTTVLPACCYYGNAHKPVACDTVVQVSTRKQILKKSGRCFICLRKGHLSSDCKSTGWCRHHHTSICEHIWLLVVLINVPLVLPDKSLRFSHLITLHYLQPVRSNTSAAQNLLAPATTPQNLSTSTTTLNPSAPTFTSTPTSTNLYVG